MIDAISWFFSSIVLYEIAVFMLSGEHHFLMLYNEWVKQRENEVCALEATSIISLISKVREGEL